MDVPAEFNATPAEPNASPAGARAPRSTRSLGISGHDRHGLGVLDEATCMRLIEHERIGRLGVSDSNGPLILPINYVLHDGRIVFRSAEGAKARAAAQSAAACLEVDRFDRFEHTGWSVLATGRLAVVSPENADAYERLPVVPWAVHGESRFYELSIEQVSGRVLRSL